MQPLRTIMNYQYRFGHSFTEATTILYQEGKIGRYYDGLGAALVQGPISRFGDTAANAGILALLHSNSYLKNLPSPVQTIFVSLCAASFRIILTPIDTLKTTLQAQGPRGTALLRQRIKTNGIGSLWWGAIATAAATFVGNYPWFATYNWLSEFLPEPPKHPLLVWLLRLAFIGFIASVVSDSVSNSLRVVKTYRQVNDTKVSYVDAARLVILQDGISGLFGRGLKTRILCNGLQGLLFSILWNLFVDFVPAVAFVEDDPEKMVVMRRPLRPKLPAGLGVVRSIYGRPRTLPAPPIVLAASLLFCRVRKVRCDGSKPCCSTCRRLQIACSLSHPIEDAAGCVASGALDLPPKYRGSLACVQCRSRKIRCMSGDTARCAACTRHDRECSYETVRPLASIGADGARRGHGPRPVNQRQRLQPYRQERLRDETGGLPASASLITPSAEPADIGNGLSVVRSIDVLLAPRIEDDTVMTLVDQYFRCLHVLPAYSFLHEETVKRRCRENTIHPALQAALCAITALFFGLHTDRRDGWASASEQMVLDGTDRPSIFHLQALLLVIRYRAESGRFGRAFMFAGMAARLAVALRLNYEHPELGPVAQEVRRRTFWSLYLLEEVFCSGMREFELCRPETVYLQLPREDIDFTNESINTGFLRPGLGLEPSTVGPRGLFVKIAFVRRQITQFNRQIYCNELNLTELFASLEQIHSSLERLESRMRPQDAYPPTDPDTFQWSPQYAMLHMSYYQCHCDLHRSFLRGHPDTAGKGCIDQIEPQDASILGDRSLQNAYRVLRVLMDYDQHVEPCQPLDWDAAVCAYQATRFVLFGSTYNKSGEHSVESSSSIHLAVRKAETVMDILSRRFSFSVPVQPMKEDLARLVESYKALLNSSTSNSGSIYNAHHGLRAPSGVSKAAGARQCLAIHSLLLRSDFVDDSREAVTKPPAAGCEEAADKPGELDPAATIQYNLPSIDVEAASTTQGTAMNGQGSETSANFPSLFFPPLPTYLMGDTTSFELNLWPDFSETYDAADDNVAADGRIDERYMY
ncbi:Mitochondrial carrier domain protein [Niveomyces insectorum RCEF 264]|uniref:Mitochondrial carrier domain protein n=1 Tax=Niveomyces insectorum RCEF 264 TaxID=1081102 RepID=A0A167RTI4_9HYPO|nr:Mitochondrial carrier domain protein [Niveomyces insectorum RCEF 264]